jgi:DNA-binding transcriptional LysR family regulator
VNLRHLQVFCAVVDCQSFSGAAEKLIMTQPAVSMQVQAVEREFGVQLLERRSRRIALTEAGRAVHHWAEEVLRSEAETRKIVDELKHAESGRIVVGAAMTVGSNILPPILHRFKRQHAGAEFVVRLGERDAVCADILAGKVDCGVHIAREIPPGLEVDIVGSEEMIFICAPSHRLARRKRVYIEDLAAEQFVMAPAGSSFRRVVDDVLGQHGLTNVSVLMELDGSDGVKRGVEQGLGIGLQTRSNIERELEHGLLHEIPVGPPLTVEMGLVYRPRQRLSPMLREFMEYLREQLREQLRPRLDLMNGEICEEQSRHPSGAAAGRGANHRPAGPR